MFRNDGEENNPAEDFDKEKVAVILFVMIVIHLADTGLEKALSYAGRAIREGGIGAFPTETFYGLAVRFDNEHSLARLYEMKKRPHEKAMPLIIGSRADLALVAEEVNDAAKVLIEAFWPGPLTLLFRAKRTISDYITAGTGKVAVRIPGQSFALDFAKSIGFPVTATSANVSGAPAAEHAQEVITYFPEGLDILIDGGKTPGGSPSTLVDVTEGKIRIVRKGVISEEAVAKVLRASGSSLNFGSGHNS